jgi:hypothetical protein
MLDGFQITQLSVSATQKLKYLNEQKNCGLKPDFLGWLQRAILNYKRNNEFSVCVLKKNSDFALFEYKS